MFSGVILLSTAFFTPLKIYYIILGSVCLIIAIISLSPLGKDTPHQRLNFKELFSTISNGDDNEHTADDADKTEIKKKNDNDFGE